MAHNWEYDGPYRYCANCKKEQEREPVHEWMRVKYYLWRPLAGKCEPKKETSDSKENE